MVYQSVNYFQTLFIFKKNSFTQDVVSPVDINAKFFYQVESQCERDIDIRGVPDPPMAIQKKPQGKPKYLFGQKFGHETRK